MRLFAIDDHPAVLATVGLVVDATPGVELVGTAHSGVAALQALLDSTHPASTSDVILVDVVMPEVSGPEFVRRYRAAGGRATVVFMSSYQPDELPSHVVGGGTTAATTSMAFLPKSELSPDALVTMLDRVAANNWGGTRGAKPNTA